MENATVKIGFARLEVSVPDRAEKSVLAPYRSRLGKVPDQQIADLANVSRTLVVNYRKKLNIAAYQGHKTTASSRPVDSGARPFRGRRSALEAYSEMLGKIPDADIARLAGVTAENVRTYRQRRNIPATWQQGVEGEVPPVAAPVVAAPPTARRPKARMPERAPRGTPTNVAEEVGSPTRSPAREAAALPVAAPPAHAPATEAPVRAATAGRAVTAYVVLVETDQGPRSYALVAGDIAAAAAEASERVAVRHPGAAIRSIQRVAELFPG